MNIHSKLLEEGIRVNSQQEQQKVICPKCSHTRRNKTEPCLSVNLQPNMAMWTFHHCDWKGSVHQDVKGYKPKPVIKNNVVNINTNNKKACNPETLDWLQKRGIFLKTINDFKLYNTNHTDKNVITFLNEYANENKENKIKILTKYGEIEIKLYEETKYHRANFIFLIKENYFDNTLFHRVVKDFIIQGGNSDNPKISSKRRNIGKYLLPPDTKKGFKHKRGTISMPSSEIENPHKLASPYEFFIVQKKGGAHHLNGKYTPFGRVIKGMKVVDIINSQPIDKRDTPLVNIKMHVDLIE